MLATGLLLLAHAHAKKATVVITFFFKAIKKLAVFKELKYPFHSQF